MGSPKGWTLATKKLSAWYPDTLHGRYAAVALSLALLTMLAAAVANWYVERSHERNLQNVELRRALTETTRRLRNAIWDTEYSLRAYLLSPTNEHKDAIHDGFNQALALLAKLSPPDNQLVGLRVAGEDLKRRLLRLRIEVNRLIVIRTDPAQLFPSMPVLRDVLSPSNREFYTAATLAMEEMAENDEKQTPAYELFQEVRHLWTRMIGVFRLYLVNHTGLFGDPDEGIRVQDRNLDILHSEIQNLLGQIQVLNNDGQLGLQSADSLAHMREIAATWYKAYRDVREQHSGDRWRADIPLLKTTIEPGFRSVWEGLETIERHIQASADRDAEALGWLASGAANALWGLAALLVLFTGAGYFYIKRIILQPIATVTQALRAEARATDGLGEAPELPRLPADQPRETRELTQAFFSMREQIRQRQAALHFQATHDNLTGLPNRVYITERIRHMVVSPERDGSGFALLLLDLDRFKEINDTLGHQFGDQILEQVSARLTFELRDEDIVARWGGDEFLLLLPDASLHYAEQAAEAVLKALQKGFLIQDMKLHVGGSIGIAVYPDHGLDAATLIRHADVAMYEAKRNGGGHTCYDPELDPNSVRRLALVANLRDAVERGELDIHYQAQRHLKDGSISGVEALVRWQHPERGPISPMELIPLAEQNGLIRKLTLFMLEGALQQWRTWRNQGLKLELAVNLSAWNLQDANLDRQLAALLEHFKVDVSQLTLEITESAMMSNPEQAITVMSRLAGMGVKLAIDDYGTGFSSLSYISRLPVKALKIDKSFVTDMCRNDHDAIIVRSTIDLAHNLGLSVTAEGVEDRDTLNLLEILRCDTVQGYYIARPLDGKTLADWLSRKEDGTILPMRSPSSR